MSEQEKPQCMAMKLSPPNKETQCDRRGRCFVQYGGLALHLCQQHFDIYTVGRALDVIIENDTVLTLKRKGM